MTETSPGLSFIKKSTTTSPHSFPTRSPSLLKQTAKSRFNKLIFVTLISHSSSHFFHNNPRQQKGSLLLVLFFFEVEEEEDEKKTKDNMFRRGYGTAAVVALVAASFTSDTAAFSFQGEFPFRCPENQRRYDSIGWPFGTTDRKGEGMQKKDLLFRLRKISECEPRKQKDKPKDGMDGTFVYPSFLCIRSSFSRPSLLTDQRKNLSRQRILSLCLVIKKKQNSFDERPALP